MWRRPCNIPARVLASMVGHVAGVSWFSFRSTHVHTLCAPAGALLVGGIVAAFGNPGAKPRRRKAAEQRRHVEGLQCDVSEAGRAHPRRPPAAGDGGSKTHGCDGTLVRAPRDLDF